MLVFRRFKLNKHSTIQTLLHLLQPGVWRAQGPTTMDDIIKELSAQDVMTDEGYARLKMFAQHSRNYIENIYIDFEDGCVSLECKVADVVGENGKESDMEQVEDVMHALIDVMCRELVYGWDLINDAYVSVFVGEESDNLMSADMIYDREGGKIKVGLLRRGKNKAVVYEYDI